MICVAANDPVSGRATGLRHASPPAARGSGSPGTFFANLHQTIRSDGTEPCKCHLPNGPAAKSAMTDTWCGARGRDEAQRYNRGLFRVARSILRDDAEAEDVVQETYVRAFTGLEHFRGDSGFGTWITRIAMNEALGRLRKRRPTVEWESYGENRSQAEIIDFPVSAASKDPERIMARGEIRAVLERAIDELPDGFRAVFVARLVEGMTVEETANLFGLQAETVKTRLHRARALLRDALDKQLGPALTSTLPFDGRRCERMTEEVVRRLCCGPLASNLRPHAAPAASNGGSTMLSRLMTAVAAFGLMSGAAFAQAKLTDLQIAHIAYTAGQIDIEAAKQALTKSKNQEVCAFADDMVRDHTAVNKQALALVDKLKVKPEDNATSQALTKQAEAKRTELAKLEGSAFDKAYVDNEVAYHRTVDSALETQLIPSASNGELKSLLQTGLKIFQGHEQHAQMVDAKLK